MKIYSHLASDQTQPDQISDEPRRMPACDRLHSGIPSDVYIDSSGGRRCRVCVSERNRQWRTENREKHLERTRLWHQQVKREAFEAYGGRCFCCGETRLWALTLDHIDGDGGAHLDWLKQQGINSRGLYRWLKSQGYPGKGTWLRVACGTCHLGLTHNNQVCPHELERQQAGQVAS